MNSKRDTINPKGKWINRDDRGVASTVGTIMSLMVFLAFLAMFTNQWVPVYMYESEANHVNDMMLTVTRFKTDMDLQILAYRVAQMTNYTSYNPPSMYHSFELGADGIPVFASDTLGQLSFKSSGDIANEARPRYIVEDFNYSASSTFEGMEAGGAMDVYMPNRYLIQERIIYENGAIIIKQDEGAFVKDGPQFFVEKGSGVVNISMTIVHLFGTDRTITGVAPAGLNSQLLWVESETYSDLTDDVTIVLRSVYSQAWYTYYFNYLHTVSGLDDVNDYTNIIRWIYSFDLMVLYRRRLI